MEGCCRRPRASTTMSSALPFWAARWASSKFGELEGESYRLYGWYLRATTSGSTATAASPGRRFGLGHRDERRPAGHRCSRTPSSPTPGTTTMSTW
ncbi:MAG: hypothetical protein MZV70_29715 [Desulfobacterales bacterium]|nr:hypothetical protein [Desulfobacterales bacterium]